MNLKKIGNIFTSKFVGTEPSSYKKRIYRAAVSQRLRNTGIHDYVDKHGLQNIKYSIGHYIPEFCNLHCIPISILKAIKTR